MGARIVPNDPHAHKPDSLFRKILPLQGSLFPGATFAITHKAIFQNIRLVREELERRVDGGDMRVPVLLIIEEMGRLIRDKEIAQEIAVVLQALSEEGRGFNVFVIAGGQNVIGREFALFRRSFISSLVHRAQEDNARIFIPQYAKAALSLPVGTAFVTDADGTTERLTQALITRQDIEHLSGVWMSDAEIDDWLRNQPRSPVAVEESDHPTVPIVGHTGNARTIGWDQPGERAGIKITPFPQQVQIGPGDPITERERAQIEILARQGFSARSIKKALGLSSRRYWIIPAVLKDLGIVTDEAEEEEQAE